MHCIDATYCCRYRTQRGLCAGLCVLGMRVSCTETAKAIEMPFGGRTQVDPGKHVLDGFPDPTGMGNFVGDVRLIKKH